MPENINTTPLGDIERENRRRSRRPARHGRRGPRVHGLQHGISAAQQLEGIRHRPREARAYVQGVPRARWRVVHRPQGRRVRYPGHERLRQVHHAQDHRRRARSHRRHLHHQRQHRAFDRTRRRLRHGAHRAREHLPERRASGLFEEVHPAALRRDASTSRRSRSSSTCR